MSKNCSYHQCLKQGTCKNKAWLGYLALCKTDRLTCRHRAPYPYGRYEPEDILLP